MIEVKIIEVFKTSGMTRVEFAAKLNISNATLSHLASGRNKASLDLVIAVLNNFPEISSDWLILNKGEMYRTGIEMKKLKGQLNQHIDKVGYLNQQIASTLEILSIEIKELK